MVRAFKIKEGISHYHQHKLEFCQTHKGQSLPDVLPNLLLEQQKQNYLPTPPIQQSPLNVCHPLWKQLKQLFKDHGSDVLICCTEQWQPVAMVQDLDEINMTKQSAMMLRRRAVLFPGVMQNNLFMWEWSIFQSAAQWGYTVLNQGWTCTSESLENMVLGIAEEIKMTGCWTTGKLQGLKPLPCVNVERQQRGPFKVN